jgi:hypothetical protein
MSTRYTAQAADAALRTAERIASAPDVVAALDAAGADVAALVASAERAVGVAHRGSTGRTVSLPSTRRTESGAVPVHRTMGRGTDADAYELLDGAPVGRPESLDAQRAEASARYWDTHRATGYVSAAAKRRARRARAGAP